MKATIDIYDVYKQLGTPDQMMFLYHFLNNDYDSLLNTFVCRVKMIDNYIILEANKKKYLSNTILQLFMDGFVCESRTNIMFRKKEKFKYSIRYEVVGFSQPIILN